MTERHRRPWSGVRYPFVRSVRSRQCVAPAQRRSRTGYPVRAATLERAPCVSGDPCGTGLRVLLWPRASRWPVGRWSWPRLWPGVGPGQPPAQVPCPARLCQRLLTGPPLRLRLSSSPPPLLSRFRPGQQDNCAAGVLAGQVGCWRWRFGEVMTRSSATRLLSPSKDRAGSWRLPGTDIAAVSVTIARPYLTGLGSQPAYRTQRQHALRVCPAKGETCATGRRHGGRPGACWLSARREEGQWALFLTGRQPVGLGEPGGRALQAGRVW